jgi:hypothetical protein
MIWSGHVDEKCLAGKTEENRPLGRHRLRWEDNIKMDLKETGCEGMEWIEVDPLAGFCEQGTEHTDKVSDSFSKTLPYGVSEAVMNLVSHLPL